MLSMNFPKLEVCVRTQNEEGFDPEFQKTDRLTDSNEKERKVVLLFSEFVFFFCLF